MLYLNKNNNVCNNCSINFEHNIAGVGKYSNSIPIMEIYESYLDNTCRIKRYEFGFLENVELQ